MPIRYFVTKQLLLLSVTNDLMVSRQSRQRRNERGDCNQSKTNEKIQCCQTDSDRLSVLPQNQPQRTAFLPRRRMLHACPLGLGRSHRMRIPQYPPIELALVHFNRNVPGVAAGRVWAPSRHLSLRHIGLVPDTLVLSEISCQVTNTSVRHLTEHSYFCGSAAHLTPAMNTAAAGIHSS